MRVKNTVDFKSKSTVFLHSSVSKFIAVLQILRKIKVEVHMNEEYAEIASRILDEWLSESDGS